MTSKIVNTATIINTDSYAWSNPYGGDWATLSDWVDLNSGTVVSPPGVNNAVTINGGAGVFTNILGTGKAAQLSVSQDVLLWGTVAVTGGVTIANPSTVTTSGTVISSELDLDGSAVLSSAALSVGYGAALAVGGGSSLTVTGLASIGGSFLDATNGSVVKLGSLIATSVVAVDDNSSLEVGTTGGAAVGAVTIDKNASAAVSGSIYGNLVLNGALGIQAGAGLAIDVTDPFGAASKISGTGTLVLSQNSHLTLGVADSAAIQFGGPAGNLVLDAIPTGTISGFAAGDVISTNLATGLTYKTTATAATLSLTKGGKAVGTLTLAGNYSSTSDLFHLAVSASGIASITLQTIGIAPVPPTLILGTIGGDLLTATANNQTLTGQGGGDTLSDGGFTGIDFKDTWADLSGSTISAFGLSDVIDLTDIAPASASANFTSSSTITVGNSFTVTPAVLTVKDATHTAAIAFTVTGTVAAGYFSTSADSGTGTDVKYVTVNTDSYELGSVLGGAFGVASNWWDTSISAAAALAPSYGNNLTIGGGVAAYTDISGNGVAASLTSTGDVLLLGTVALGGKVIGVSGTLTQSGTLALAGLANLSLTGQVAVGGEVEIGGASKLTAAGLAFIGTGGAVVAFGGSSAQFAILNGTTSFMATTYQPSAIGVDATSSIELGTTGSAAAGALTIDNGVTADLFGNINGNVVVNGTLAVAGTLLAIGSFGTVLPAVTGAGTIDLFVGQTLSIAGSDSAAIQFSTSYNSIGDAAAETLALATSLPTGTISGYAAGDVISVAEPITGVTYAASSAGGTLTLLNGTAKIGTLLLAGSYAASQFQVSVTAGGQSSDILLASAPTGALGTSAVSSNSDTYAWSTASGSTFGNGGAWGSAGNWIDLSTGKIATTAPGAGNAVTIPSLMASPYGPDQIISGTGSAASLSISMPAILTASLSIAGLLTVNASSQVGSVTGFAGGATVKVGSVAIDSAFQVAGASNLTDSGVATILGNFSILGASTVTLTGAAATTLSGGYITVDATSRFEVGSAGTAAAGSLTIDSGHSLVVGSSMIDPGPSDIAGNLVVNGSLAVASGLIKGFAGTAGSITGTGTIDVGTNGPGGSNHLVIASSDSAAITFINNSTPNPGAGAGDSLLEFKGPLPTGAISGFVSGDVIQVDKTVTGISFTQTTATQGTLTLTNGTLAVGTLTLAGSSTADLFHLDVTAATGYGTITVQTAAAAAGTGAGSTTKDAYSWTGASGGVWSTAANWSDTTTGKTVTTVAGSGNAVSIAGNTVGNETATTVGGNGAAASLAVSGDVLLTGTVAVGGQLSVALASTIGELDLDSKATLTAVSAAITGTLQAGDGSSATVSGITTLSGVAVVNTQTGNTVQVGGAITVLNGSTVQVGGLIANNGNDVLAVDSTSIFKIGAPATAAAGAITEAAGATAALSGSIYGNLVAGGTVAVAGGGSLLIDLAGSVVSDPYSTTPTISGGGVLSITEGSTLGLGAADSAAIQFAGPNGTLGLAQLPTATISGFAAGDQIEIGQEVTGLSYKQGTGTGTLTLSNGSATLGTLTLSGSYAANAFHLDAAANGSTAVITLQTLGVVATQPTLIQGTAAADQLTATANGQTLTGGGGADTLLGGGLAGLDFKDLTANLNGSSIQGFATSDIIDFTDLKLATATENYEAGSLTVGDGTHLATLTVGFANYPVTGSFHVSSDGASGTKLSWS